VTGREEVMNERSRGVWGARALSMRAAGQGEEGGGMEDLKISISTY
jgi:hypothetical protein